jgi:hypothetical protein
MNISDTEEARIRPLLLEGGPEKSHPLRKRKYGSSLVDLFTRRIGGHHTDDALRELIAGTVRSVGASAKDAEDASRTMLRGRSASAMMLLGLDHVVFQGWQELLDGSEDALVIPM